MTTTFGSDVLVPLPPAVAATLPPRAQELLGYSIWPPFMGHVGGLHPKRLLPQNGERGNVYRLLQQFLLPGKIATLNKLNPAPFVEIHPEDAAELDIDLEALAAQYADAVFWSNATQPGQGDLFD